MEHWKDYKCFLLRIIADIFIIILSWVIAYYLRFYIIPGGIGKPLLFFSQLCLLIVVLFIFFINKNKLYSSMRSTSWINEFTSIVLSSFQTILALIIILYFFFPERVSRLTIALFLVIVVILLIIERLIVKNFLFFLRSKGWNSKNVLLIGFGETLEKYVESNKNPLFGIKIIGQFGSENGNQIEGVKQYTGELSNVLDSLKPDIVVLNFPEAFFEISQKCIAICYDRTSMLMVILDFHFSLIGSKIVSLNDQHVLQINHPTFTNFDRVIKRFVDISASLIGLIILSPIMLIISFLVKITSKGPVFFTQKRITEGEQVFKMFKFRSMKQDTQMSGNGMSEWTVKNDSRITGFGKYIRKTSLDELPQLFNVLLGNMSLIGPRPERPELIGNFGKEIPGYRLRHKVKAGITGWAQVNGWRGNTSLEKRIEFDLYYVQNWSLMLDFKIIFLTVIKGFINKNAY